MLGKLSQQNILNKQKTKKQTNNKPYDNESVSIQKTKEVQ